MALYIHQYGPRDGKPVVFFHGFPGTHKQAELIHPWAESLGLNILAVDRPGYGFSEPIAGGLTEFLPLLKSALDKYHIGQEIYLVGISGGNAAALSSAAYLGARVKALACVCGVAPFREAPETYSKSFRSGLNMARRLPTALLRPAIESFIRNFDPKEKFDEIISKLSSPDQAVLRDPIVRSNLLASLDLARRQGSSGILFDLKSFASDWPLNWDDVRCPTTIWHGGRDLVLSPDMARFLKSRLAHAALKLYPDEGHYSLAIGRAEEILRDLIKNPLS